MIVVYGGIEVRPEEVDAVSRIAGEFVAAVQAEAGCLAYELSWDVARPQHLHLLEHWADEEAYAAHRQQPHVAQWASRITAAQQSPVQSVKLTATPRTV